ncbi:MAG: hypothetical protein OEZ39_02485 [Gammaproteobacteria bacterium]|nr:hypothetical protein [Gammaproteobacteria bacterium]MDH5650722.1 hypothetical protein [Gammaproteobacteria bacterium]
MGTIYKASCPCGFEQFKLLQGRGLDRNAGSLEIFQCEGCHALINGEVDQSVDSLFEPIPCPDCKGTLHRMGGDADQHAWYCPECHEETLTLTIIGLWN